MLKEFTDGGVNGGKAAVGNSYQAAKAVQG